MSWRDALDRQLQSWRRDWHRLAQTMVIYDAGLYDKRAPSVLDAHRRNAPERQERFRRS